MKSSGRLLKIYPVRVSKIKSFSGGQGGRFCQKSPPGFFRRSGWADLMFFSTAHPGRVCCQTGRESFEVCLQVFRSGIKDSHSFLPFLSMPVHFSKIDDTWHQ
jgi:hypothetical protein